MEKEALYKGSYGKPPPGGVEKNRPGKGGVRQKEWKQNEGKEHYENHKKKKQSCERGGPAKKREVWGRGIKKDNTRRNTQFCGGAWGNAKGKGSGRKGKSLGVAWEGVGPHTKGETEKKGERRVRKKRKGMAREKRPRERGGISISLALHREENRMASGEENRNSAAWEALKNRRGRRGES